MPRVGLRVRRTDPPEWRALRDALSDVLDGLVRRTPTIVASIMSGREAPISDQLTIAKAVADDALVRATSAVWESESLATARRLNITPPYQSVRSAAASYARENAGQLVRSISVEQRAAISLRVEEALRLIGGRQGVSFPMPTPGDTYSGVVQRVTRQVRPLVGLTESQARAVSNYRAQLQRAAETGRSSAAINRRALAPNLSQRQAARLTQARIDKLVNAYGERFRTHRAQTIAATEVHDALMHGRRTAIETAYQSGRLSLRTGIVWVAQIGACELCSALDGQVVDVIGGRWGGNHTNPPAHPRCRCSLDVVEFSRSELEMEGQ